MKMQRNPYEWLQQMKKIWDRKDEIVEGLKEKGITENTIQEGEIFNNFQNNLSFNLDCFEILKRLDYADLIYIDFDSIQLVLLHNKIYHYLEYLEYNIYNLVL